MLEGSGDSSTQLDVDVHNTRTTLTLQELVASQTACSALLLQLLYVMLLTKYVQRACRRVMNAF